jgi:predicted ABC-class ATPase
MMNDAPQPMDTLGALLQELDGQPFQEYQKLLNRAFHHRTFRFCLVHVQGSSGAFPASVGHLSLKKSELGLVDSCLSNRARRMATADYLLRAFKAGVDAHARQNRGVRGSGSFQPMTLPPQVLERNAVMFDATDVRIAFIISLPASKDNRILGRQALRMLSVEMTAIVEALKASIARNVQLKKHCDVIEDWVVLQRRLPSYGLIGFIGDGAILPRQSGVCQAPLKEGAVAFQAPDQLAVEVEFPNVGRMRGLGIRPGVNALIGGGFHGKSTLLNALAMGVYPHIPADGRERVVTHPDAAFICAEEGRAVNGVDISGFIDNLPGHSDAKSFQTQNASGSTSEAAAIIEAVLAGAKLLLIDEDSSATNFLIKDHNMRQLIPEDPITPLFDRVRELHERYGVSTLIAAGGSSECLGVAQHVIAMQNYLPVCMTERARRLTLPEPNKPAQPLTISDKRRLLADNFNPCYHARRLDKTIAVRIKALRLQEKILEYGNAQLDLAKLIALVDPQQVRALGYALLLARIKFKDTPLSPSALAAALHEMIEAEGLEILSSNDTIPIFLARPRQLELAGAINRLRNLRVEIIKAHP